MSSDHSVSDASYAYKLKREKLEGTPTTSQELNEIVDNVKSGGELDCFGHSAHRCGEHVH